MGGFVCFLALAVGLFIFDAALHRKTKPGAAVIPYATKGSATTCRTNRDH